MTPISLDFSQKRELIPLATVVQDLRGVAQALGIDYFLMGAAARDLMLQHAHNITPSRLTEDVDFAVSVPNWSSFEALRAALLGSDQFFGSPGPAIHKLRHKATGLPLDIVPFGGIEDTNRKISWPPDHHIAFDCFGAREAFETSVPVQLPNNVTLHVASIPALALLKITAWEDRKHSHPGRDAGDLMLYVRHYMDCDNTDRAAQDHGDLFTTDDYDHEASGARLLGRDIANLLDKQSIEPVLSILLPQADTEGSLLLAQQSGLDLEHARRLVAALCDGLSDNL
ncbi:MAG: nucleotidyl transferase AbiEii/AbiGii toxin family protein [Undibacterium sp.]|nr:nucleotidyl transferase AbiEii/AbiGii toxin family protein [Undibacterium sp.]